MAYRRDQRVSVMFPLSTVLLGLATLILVINALGFVFTILRRRDHKTSKQDNRAEDHNRQGEKQLATSH